MEQHTRYLELRLARCLPRAEIHRHQIEALNELIPLARSGIGAAAYCRKTGNLFPLAQAECLDRQANLVAIHTALGDNGQLRSAEVYARAAEDAGTHHELVANYDAVKAQVDSVRLAADSCSNALPNLVVTLLRWATESSETERAVLAATLGGLWSHFQEYDPGCSWDRISRHPPYRNRLPFDDRALLRIGSWLRQALGHRAETGGARRKYTLRLKVHSAPEEEGARLPSVEEAARGYHIAYESVKAVPGQSRLMPLYGRIFEIESRADDPNQFNRRLLEEDLPCELIRQQMYGVADDALHHCVGLSQPHIEFHYRTLADTLRRCGTGTEMEYEIARLDACFSVESAWHEVFLAYAFHPVIAAMKYEFTPSRACQQHVRTTYRVVSELFGADWKRLFDSPRVREFFRDVIFTATQPLLARLRDDRYRGEVGLELATGFRYHALANVRSFVANRDDPTREEIRDRVDLLMKSDRFATPREMRSHVTLMFDTAMAGAEDGAPAPPEGRDLVFWGKPLSLEEVRDALSSPPRPFIRRARPPEDDSRS